MVCTGCALLCDDISFSILDDGSTQFFNVCRRGFTMLKTHVLERGIVTQTIRGKESTLSDCIAEAAGMLRKAHHPKIIGLENATMDAQILGIKLAKRLGATIDDLSFFSFGGIFEAIIEGRLPTCSLEEVKRWADTVIYWGAYPHKSHPRHLSRFYYPSTEEVQGGSELQRILASVDIRLSETAAVSNHVFLLKPGEDGDFLDSILGHLLRGDCVDSRVRDFVKVVTGSRFCVIYAGLGLVRALGGRLEQFIQVIHELGKYTSIRVIPMFSYSNTRGLYELLNAEKSLSSLKQTGTEDCDCSLVFGANQETSLSESTNSELQQVPRITVDPLPSSTVRESAVSIRIGLPGLETNGDMVRMDGMKLSLQPELAPIEITDKLILEMLMEAT